MELIAVHDPSYRHNNQTQKITPMIDDDTAKVQHYTYQAQQ